MGGFLSCFSSQDAPDSHSASYLLGHQTVASSLKLVSAEAEHSLPSDVNILNAWSITTVSPYITNTWCFRKETALL